MQKREVNAVLGDLKSTVRKLMYRKVRLTFERGGIFDEVYGAITEVDVQDNDRVRIHLAGGSVPGNGMWFRLGPGSDPVTTTYVTIEDYDYA